MGGNIQADFERAHLVHFVRITLVASYEKTGGEVGIIYPAALSFSAPYLAPCKVAVPVVLVVRYCALADLFGFL